MLKNQITPATSSGQYWWIPNTIVFEIIIGNQSLRFLAFVWTKNDDKIYSKYQPQIWFSFTINIFLFYYTKCFQTQFPSRWGVKCSHLWKKFDKIKKCSSAVYKYQGGKRKIVKYGNLGILLSNSTNLGKSNLYNFFKLVVILLKIIWILGK